MAVPYAATLAPRAARQRELTPDYDTESLLKRVGQRSLSGLAAAGSLLDLPGSSVRDVLAGENPFDQWLSPLSGENRVSGRDLMHQYGLLGRNKKGFDWGDVAGFAGEVALDPLTYLTFGASAVGKGGQIAKRAGVLTDALKASGKGPRVGRMTETLGGIAKRATPDELSRLGDAATKMGFSSLDDALARHGGEAVGGLVGVGLPFKSPVFTLGKAGGKAESVARGMDAAGKAVKGTAPVRYFRGLMDPSVMGRFGKAEQPIAEAVYTAQRRSKAPANEAVMDFAREMDEVYSEFDDVLGPGIRRNISDVDIDPRDLDEESFADMLRSTDPRPVRTAQGVIAEAEGVAREGRLRGQGDDLPFRQGEVVVASDRGNYGYVQQAGPRSSRVLFRNPETGAVATKVFNNDELTHAFDAASTEALQWSQLATRKVYGDTIRAIAETGDVDAAARYFMGDVNVPADLKQRLRGVAEMARAAKDEVYAAIDEMGGQTAWHGVEQGFKTNHFPRFVPDNLAKEMVNEPGRAFKTLFQSMLSRSPEIRDLPAHVVNEITSKPRYRGENAAQKILDDFWDQLDESWGQQADEFVFPDPDVAKAEHSKAIAKWVKDHPQTELFARSTLDDFTDYMRGGHRVAASLKAMHGYLSQAARVGGEVPLTDVFRRAGLDTDKALGYFERITGKGGAKLGVDEETAKAMVGLWKLFDDKFDGPIAELIDKWNSVFKSSVTVMFPSFHARNALSGQFVNASSGYIESASDMTKYTRQLGEARRLLRAAREGNLTAEQQKWLDEIEAFSVIDKRKGFQDVDVISTGPGWVPDNPLGLKKTAQAARQAVAESPSSLDAIPGMRAARRGYHTAIGTGSNVTAQTEWYNRVPMYLYLRKQGYAKQAAKDIVDQLQFDYSDVSDFHRNVLKRAVPFATFTRKMSELLARQLLSRPGGMVGQTIRASNAMRSDEPMPEYVSQGMAVPLGELDDGTKRYLAGFGFAHEDPLSLLSARGGWPDFSDMTSEAISRSNPAIKFPIELAAGESFFQRGPMGGRELADMDPTYGRLLTNLGLRKELPTGRAKPVVSANFENLLSNLPTARLGTTARSLTDPRKYEGGPFPGSVALLNNLTGFRVSDISPGAQDAILRDELFAAMREQGARAFENVRYSKSDIETAEKTNPDLAEQMRRYNAAVAALTNRAKARKKDEKKPVRLRRAG